MDNVIFGKPWGEGHVNLKMAIFVVKGHVIVICPNNPSTSYSTKDANEGSTSTINVAENTACIPIGLFDLLGAVHFTGAYSEDIGVCHSRECMAFSHTLMFRH